MAIATTFDSYDIGVPSFNSRRALIYVSGGAYTHGTTNNVYATWTDLSGATGCTAPANEPGTNAASTCKTRIWFSRSTDGGATWARAGDDQQPGRRSTTSSTSGWRSTRPPARSAVIYYDTVGDAGRKKIDVWYQSSSDDGATWSAAGQGDHRA